MTAYIDPELVRKCFEYDPESGVLERVGTLETRGARPKGRRLHIAHGGKKYYRHGVFNSNVYEHRLIWVWMTGQQPLTIDHIDGDGLNNKWHNLRSVAHSHNTKNQKLHSTNTSGVMGVNYRKDIGKWRARIMVNGESLNLGSYESKAAAIQAREDALKNYGFHENHGKRIAA